VGNTKTGFYRLYDLLIDYSVWFTNFMSGKQTFFIKLHVYTCLIKYCLCSLFPSFVRNFLCRGTTQDEVIKGAYYYHMCLCFILFYYFCHTKYAHTVYCMRMSWFNFMLGLWICRNKCHMWIISRFESWVVLMCYII